MLTFHWSELLVVVIGGLVLFLGLAFLMLRRRNEVLQRFLTPDEPSLEEEFFRVHRPKQDEASQEDTDVETEINEAEEVDEEVVRWGVSGKTVDQTDLNSVV